ncbi:TPA: co-chaperone DjlA [Legionella pneumophila]|nr:co-chaperone DjlA [Legionella pneumophila]HAU1320729.1 co-chaperone DjlA [Legionella pneumophila]HBC0463074.1 co-chaperone DjlA [Legionella pneumophila]HBC0468001.1 co-chaperone DjlA [Legionella pneumophila]HBD9373879.1 co-chaperone DjlA [Legionella pneumophila]
MNLRDFFIITTWWGKILGAFFGYLTAGPVGALFGILVGNFFDRGLVSYYSNPHWLYHAEKQKIVQKAFFEATFSIMGHVAKSDGRVSEEEINMAKSLMSEMKLNKEQKDLAKRLFNEGKQPDFNVSLALIQLQRICKDNRDLLKLFVDIQYRAAQVDGLNSQKIHALDNIFTHLGFAPLHKQYRFYEDFGSYFQQEQPKQHYHNQQGYQHTSSSQGQRSYKPQSPPNALAHAYALLEVSPNANKQEVRRAYRRLLSRNHPDKLIAQGLPEEMIKLANDKTHQIMKAYELICETKGW